MKNEKNRITFFSITDMSCGHYLSLAEPILRYCDTNMKIEDINDIIELEQIKKYIDADLYLNVWTEEDKSLFKSKSQIYKDLIGRFFAKIDDKNILSYYEQLDIEYHRAFWRLLDEHKVYKRVSSEVFCILINKPNIWIHEVLKQKRLVSHYKVHLRLFLLSYETTAELLMSIYEQKKDSHDEPMFLPDNLTLSDKEDVISRYLNNGNANLNYIRLIQNARDHNNLRISAKTRLKAKKRAEEENEKMLNTGYTWTNSISVSFSGEQEEIKTCSKIDSTTYDFSYSYHYVKKYNDSLSLFRNFVLLFEYLDEQLRVELVSKRSDKGLFDILGLHSQNEYPVTPAFRWKNQLSHLQIAAYDNVLKTEGKRIEDVLCDIYKNHFSQEYDLFNTQLIMPSESTSYLEKVRILAPEFESILKQYYLFVTEGEIDFELLQINSSPSTISNIPSLVPKKYIYVNPNCNEAIYVQHCFFSDQATLAYVEPFENKYQRLFDLLINEEVNFECFKNYQLPKIQYLIEIKMLSVDEHNIVRLERLEKLFILKDLYENEVGCYWHYPFLLRQVADEMNAENMLYFEKSLFTKQEQSFFNYHLNKAEFTNGLDLRNSYLHGTQAHYDKEQMHMGSYFIYLKLFVLALFKIEDDLAISKENKRLNINEEETTA